MKYVASCSCGKDSLAMVLTLIEKKAPLDCVIFFDAGKEFESVYRNWNKLKVILAENNIEAVTLTANKTFDYYFSEHKIKTRDASAKIGYSWCGGRCRWMTQFKVSAISNFYKEHFKNEVIVEYVGIAKDELDRVNIKRENTIKVYPLIYWNMTENDCLVKCYKSGFNWLENNGIDLYDVLDRVSCYCCSNKNLKELKAIYKYLPTYWQKLKAMQNKTNIPFRKNGETIQDLENKFISQKIEFTKEN